MVNAFAKAAPHIKSVATALAAVTAGVISFRIAFTSLTVMQTIITLFKAWRAGTLAQTAAQIGLNVAMMANPMTWVAVGIAALIAAGVALVMNWDKVKKKSLEVWDVVKEKVSNFIKPVKKWFDGLVGSVTSFIDKITSFGNIKIGLPKFLGGNGLFQKKAIGGVISSSLYPSSSPVQRLQRLRLQFQQQPMSLDLPSLQHSDQFVQPSVPTFQHAKL
eukprot:TRINITY_DN18646_c0_g1_i2.p1 TRINITY_DN18646_c0_g1~~TRINITY_DN18646_c0_g1_i2.p1  ORF type:complete len:235 (+),score=26.82 TRINITY_DN18646_c0_g1_i2:53-706(+)